MEKWFTIKKLTNHIWGIGEFRHFEEVISYLMIGKKEALLFDTGLGIHNIKKVVEIITKKKLFIINSHRHFDHIGGNKYFSKNYFVKKKSKILKIDPYCFNIIKTPGHSPDSICLHEKKLGFLFSGDTLYPGPIYLQLPESDFSSYKKSLKKLSRLKIKKIFPSHNNFIFSKSDFSLLIKTVMNIKHTKKIKKIYIRGKLSLLFSN